MLNNVWARVPKYDRDMLSHIQIKFSFVGGTDDIPYSANEYMHFAM